VRHVTDLNFLPAAALQFRCHVRQAAQADAVLADGALLADQHQVPQLVVADPLHRGRVVLPRLQRHAAIQPGVRPLGVVPVRPGGEPPGQPLDPHRRGCSAGGRPCPRRGPVIQRAVQLPGRVPRAAGEPGQPAQQRGVDGAVQPLDLALAGARIPAAASR